MWSYDLFQHILPKLGTQFFDLLIFRTKHFLHVLVLVSVIEAFTQLLLSRKCKGRGNREVWSF